MASLSSAFDFLLCFCSLLSLFPLIFSISIPLSQFQTNPSTNPFQNIFHLASASLSRAHHLKNAQRKHTTATTTPVYSHSHGGYSIFISFGTPPQTLPFVVDTGSDVVWFPCTSRYTCLNCSSSIGAPRHIPYFNPDESSTSRTLGCLNPKCSWIPHTNITCTDCNTNDPRNCSQICPGYLIGSGLGSTGGIALFETLRMLPHWNFPDFLVGCSVLSYHQPAGIAGFGRGPASLPSQLGLDKFSYCLPSHQFDDTMRNSSLVLTIGSDSDEKTPSVSYTPLLRTPIVALSPMFSAYYYVDITEISLEITLPGKRVRIPHKHLSLDAGGNGGTVIDSGMTFTFMTHHLFQRMVHFMNAHIKNPRALEAEVSTGLHPCYDVSSAGETHSLPVLTLFFKGGAEVTLPVENFFAMVGSGAACLAVVTDGLEGAMTSIGGPSIIVGSFQMQNFYVEYDLRNERIGFKQQLCN